MVELKSRLGLELSESVSLGAPGMDSSGSISAGAAAAVRLACGRGLVGAGGRGRTVQPQRVRARGRCRTTRPSARQVLHLVMAAAVGGGI